jgi:hypothetical protein
MADLSQSCRHCAAVPAPARWSAVSAARDDATESVTPSPHPARLMADAVAAHGESTMVAACVGLLGGAEVDDDLVVALAGQQGVAALEGRGYREYWLRVWGARGLLYVWDDAAAPALLDAVGDEQWRVREMVAKVVARRLVDEGARAVASLRDDPVPRVRAAAERALRRLANDHVV